MISGLKEFRQKLSEYTKLVSKGYEIVVLTDRNIPVTAYVSANKLRELAKKAEDTVVLKQLSEANADKNREFIEQKHIRRNEIEHFYNEAMKYKGQIQDAVIVKLRAILETIEEIISDDGSLSDQRLLEALYIKSRQPISRVLDYDYYHIHKDFLEKVKFETKEITTKIITAGRSTELSNELRLLTDIIEKAVIREKYDNEEMVKGLCSILVRITKKEQYISSRIYTIMPAWYDNIKSNKYFIQEYSEIAEEMLNKKIGDKFSYKGEEYEILSIT